MSYCPKCGNKIDETMVFCPRCGAPLKGETSWQAGSTATPQTSPEYRYRHRHEKHDEKAEKHGEKHEKGGAGYGYLIAGVIVVVLGLLAYINATTNYFRNLNGPAVSAIVLVVIGIIIVLAGIYYSARSRRRNPTPP
jgi:uncharacterized Zn finger protein (UPF0148 family)